MIELLLFISLLCFVLLVFKAWETPQGSKEFLAIYVCSVVAWYIFPPILNSIFNVYSLIRMPFDFDSYKRITLFNLLVILGSFYLYRLFLKIKIPFIDRLSVKVRELSFGMQLFFILFGFLFVFLVWHFTPIREYRELSYKDANRIEVVGNLGLGGVWRLVYLFMVPYPAFLLAVLFLNVNFTDRRRWLYLAASAAMFLISVDYILQGSRIWLLMVVFPVLLKFFSVGRKRIESEFLKKLALFIVLMVLSLFMLKMVIAIKELRSMGKFDASMLIVQMYEDQQSILVDAIMAIGLKFDNNLYGQVLYSSTIAGDVGFTPYFGSFLSLIPRSIFPDKPVPGSCDGSLYGLPKRVTAYYIDPNNSFLNVGTSPASDTIWQIGYWGLPFLVLLNACMMRVYDSLFRNKRIILMVMLFYMLGVPVFQGVYTSIDQLIMDGQRLFVALLLIHLVYRKNG